MISTFYNTLASDFKLTNLENYYVGIYVAKDKHYVCILDKDSKFATKPFWIYSDIVGLNELVKRLYNLSLTCDNFILAVESTGAFNENIYGYLTDLDFKVILLNSYQTAKYRDFSTMKKVKMMLLMLMLLRNLFYLKNTKKVI